jgi:hypothetical protein
LVFLCISLHKKKRHYEDSTRHFDTALHGAGMTQCSHKFLHHQSIQEGNFEVAQLDVDDDDDFFMIFTFNFLMG